MTKSVTHIVIAAVLLLASIAGYAFWYMTVESVRASVTEAVTDIDAKKAEVARIQEARSALQTLSQNEERIKAYFISKDDVGSFLEMVSGVGDELGAHIEIVSVTEESTATPHPRVSLSLSVEGTFDAVMRTIGALEYGPYDVEVRNLSLSKGGTAETSETWTAVGTYSFGAQLP